ncbi:MAG: chemotaxis-specific protein-glutamate methyltransferase CheB [Magnetococcus sp. WYHC-3]
MAPPPASEDATGMDILIVEDSQVVAMLLRAIFSRENGLRVVGHALDGAQALEMTHRLRPHIITMDIRMPRMDGLEATRRIMEEVPTPIVVVSASVDDEELRITFRAIEAGALAVIEKPRGIAHPDFETIRGNLVDMVRAMSEVPVVRRSRRNKPPSPAGLPPSPSPPSPPSPARSRGSLPSIVALGASTGGPQTLQAILERLPAHFPIPILVVQHISPGFVGGMASWLDTLTPLGVSVAANAEPLQPGRVYLAPDSVHVRVESNAQGAAVVRLTTGNHPANPHCPSVGVMLESVADQFGSRCIAGLLTGMGSDGAAALARLAACQAATFVQSRDSCVVFGMPGSALELHPGHLQLAAEDMAAFLLREVNLS